MTDWIKLNIDISKINVQGKTTCPNCSHLRNKKNDKCLSVNTDTGVYYCHHCGWTNPKGSKVYSRPEIKNNSLSKETIEWFAKRKISLDTLIKMKVTETKEYMPQSGKIETVICFNYFKDGKLVNIKYRA